MKLFLLPLHLRSQLAQPIGKLFPGAPDIAIPKLKDMLFDPGYMRYSGSESEPMYPIICVGDIVSQACLQDPELEPLIKYCFFDGGTQRGEEVEFRKDGSRKHIILTNPRGAINEEILNFIQQTWEDNSKYLVEISGEEDLLVIPAVILCRKSLVIYGQPPITDASVSIPAGCVLIETTPQVRETCQKLLDQFEIKED